MCTSTAGSPIEPSLCSLARPVGIHTTRLSSYGTRLARDAVCRPARHSPILPGRPSMPRTGGPARTKPNWPRQCGMLGRPSKFRFRPSERCGSRSKDAEDLPAAEHRALTGLLQSPPPSAPSPGADRFHYKITVEDEKGTRELEVPEHAMPEVLAGIPKISL